MFVWRAHEHSHKLRLRWFGPKRITKVLVACVYMVKDLHGSRAETVHATRLISYSERLRQSEVPQEWLDIAERTKDRYEIVHRITDIDKADGGIFLRVQ